ncbi:MAG: hypothetical protein U0223_09500 [Nitrospira sp.]|nr:hypothetical protein [Nitrospira sp.]
MNRRSQIVRTLVATVMGLLLTACTFSQAFTRSKVPDEVFVDIPRGAVFFQTGEDGWFRTTHPFDLSSELLAAVFRGIHVQISPTNPDPGERAFSDEDTDLLSPLMSIALSKATKSQVVGFRVLHELDGRQETTGGILYIQGRLLHLTLTHYRARHDDSETGVVIHRLNPNPMELNQSQITFTPEAVRRSSRHEQPDVIDCPSLASLVLDYDALIEGMKLPKISIQAHPIHQEKASLFQQILDSAFPANEVPSFHNRSILSKDVRRTIQVPSSVKEGELKALKEEMRRLQQKLSELEGNAPTPKQP